EGVTAGTALLVGAHTDAITAAANRLLDDARAYEAMAKSHNPYGDGTASRQIAEIIARSHAG
ncbi:MAG: UDP-N-acetylglucosamine 2-epimerase, partial [Porphyrobacter sp.]|nr:UDP-N-acetylglucosamine 2-epimerase [Porphyrobacter sp.]